MRLTSSEREYSFKEIFKGDTMIKRNLSKGMINLLKSLIGSDLISYECDSEYDIPLGNMRLNTSIYSVEITNFLEDKPLLGETEEISGFKCKKVDPRVAFKPYCIAIPKTFNLTGNIKCIDIIRDDITVKSENYSISFDQAIIIRTDKNILMLSRDIWFDETIRIDFNDNYDDVYSTESAAYALSDYGQYEVDVKRTRIQL